MGCESMNVSKNMAYKYRASYHMQTEVIIRHTMEDGATIATLAMPSISGKTTNKKKGIKVVLEKGTGIQTVYSFCIKELKIWI